MSNPLLTAEGFTCEELAEALMIKLKPFIQESIREEFEKMNDVSQTEKSNEEVAGINTDEPIVSNYGRYSVTQVCNLLNIHRNTLINYTNQGTIRCGIRKSNGRKFYLGVDIKKLWKAQY